MSLEEFNGRVKELVRKGDSYAIYNVFKGLIYKWSRKYSWSGVDDDDFKQLSILAIICAIRKFDVDKGLNFTSYLEKWMHAYFGQYAMRNANIIRPSSQFLNHKSFTGERRRFAEEYKKYSYENIDDEDCNVQLEYEVDFDRRILREEMRKFAQRILSNKRYDILMRRCNEETMQSIADSYHISKERVRQIELESIKKIKEALHGKKI